MPMSVTKTEGGTVDRNVIRPEDLPVELYFKIVFEDPRNASQWCSQAVAAYENATLNGVVGGLQRFVVWGPAAPARNWVSGGYGNVFVSELALRVIRAIGKLRIPGAEPVSLSQFDYNLNLYVGSEVDRRAYSAIRST